MNSELFQHIIAIHELLNEGDTVIVGLSAGPDSVALLDLLCAPLLKIKPFAVYVDHGLRPLEIPGEIRCVNELCRMLSIPHEVVAVDVTQHQKHHKTSIEESCRLLRYEALERLRIAHSGKAIAVAHTADDQAEELLLRLFRGSGLKGLSGMQMKNGHIIRPLLNTTKQELLNYLDKKGLPYCIDSSNTDKRFLRNRLRLDILPQLTTHFNPSLRSTLCQTAELLHKEDEFLDYHTQQAVSLCVFKPDDSPLPRPLIDLDLSAFQTHHIALQRRIVEQICWRFDSRPSYQNIVSICHFAYEGAIGKELHLPMGLRIVKSHGKLSFYQPKGAIRYRGKYHSAQLPSMNIFKDTEYIIDSVQRKLCIKTYSEPPELSGPLKGAHLAVDMEKLNFPLILRSPYPGERFRPAGMKGSKKISRFLSDKKIPRHLRHQFPILLSQDQVVGVVGLRMDDKFSLRKSTSQYGVIIWESLPFSDH